MKIHLAPELVEPVASGLLGGITVDEGPTPEQIAVLQAVVGHLWKRPDIDVASLTPLDAEGLAKRVSDAQVRHFLVGVLMTLELCRHPETETQIAQVEQYAGALSITGEPLDVIRTWITEGAQQANEDLRRFREEKENEEDEPSLLDRSRSHTELDPELAEKIGKLADLPEGTLGRGYIEFHRKFGYAMPGTEFVPTFSNAMFVAHDLNHVISGYSPTGQGEIALGAMEFAMNDSEGTWSRFLSSLSIHEAGMSRLENFEAKEATLTRPGAADLVGEAFDRGNQCTKDFSRIDHLAMAEWPLEEVRAHFGVVPLAGGDWLSQ